MADKRQGLKDLRETDRPGPEPEGFISMRKRISAVEKHGIVGYYKKSFAFSVTKWVFMRLTHGI